MKLNLFSVIGVGVAIAASSFTVQRATNVYFDHISGAQEIRANYSQTTTALTNVAGTTQLDWIRIADDNGTVTDAEFTNMFEALDVVADASNSLNDDVEKVITSGVYQYELAKKP